MLRIKGRCVSRAVQTALAVLSLLLIMLPGCRRLEVTADRQLVTLRIGFGLAAGAIPQSGIQGAARILAFDQLVSLPRDGRPSPRLAESWSVSANGLTWRIRLHPQVTFHDGTPVNAHVLQRILQDQLPQNLGPAFEDVKEIRAISDRDIEFSLRRRSTFLLERLDFQIQRAGGSALIGTGPFSVADQENDEIEMRANRAYFAATPAIDRIVIKPYTSIRAAWADMLRGQVDMLYDVGVDALDSLEASRDVKVFTFQRGYAYVLLLNLGNPYLRDADFRRRLNAAVDRDELVRDVLRGHGTPASGPVWPHHWAYTSELPQFQYQPRPVPVSVARRRLKCIFNEPSYERLALVVQRQLQAVGVDLELELVTDSRVFGRRLEAGDFDAFLTDINSGPPLVRPFLFWYTGAPFNLGKFSSKSVDAALDAIRHAADDAAYKAGVAAFQRAIVDDPPAIFLAWRERARAVSTRFLVPAEPGTDILTALHLWRPATGERLASRR